MADEYMREMNELEEEGSPEDKQKMREFLRAIFLIPDKPKKVRKMDDMA